MVKHRNCLNVFDHFMRLALKWLISVIPTKSTNIITALKNTYEKLIEKVKKYQVFSNVLNKTFRKVITVSLKLN